MLLYISKNIFTTNAFTSILLIKKKTKPTKPEHYSEHVNTVIVLFYIIYEIDRLYLFYIFNIQHTCIPSEKKFLKTIF